MHEKPPQALFVSFVCFVVENSFVCRFFGFWKQQVQMFSHEMHEKPPQALFVSSVCFVVENSFVCRFLALGSNMSSYFHTKCTKNFVV